MRDVIKNDSGLRYQEYLPIEEIRDYIKCFWILESRDEVVDINNLLAPSGCIDILFQQTPCIFHVSLLTGTQIQLPQFIAAIQFQKGFNICLKGKVKIFGVRLQPFAGKSVLNLPVSEISNRVYAISEVLGSGYQYLGESVINSYDDQEAISILNGFFSCLNRPFLPLDYAVKDICEKLMEDETPSLHQLYDQYRETEQTIRTRFFKHVGVMPKEFSDIVHLNKVLSYAQANGMKIDLAGVAVHTNHFDQAHFSKKFKSIMNVTPGEYFKAKNPVNQFFVNKDNASYLCSFKRNCLNTF